MKKETDTLVSMRKKKIPKIDASEINILYSHYKEKRVWKIDDAVCNFTCSSILLEHLLNITQKLLQLAVYDRRFPFRRG